MADLSIEDRVKQAARTGETESFTKDEHIPAAWIVDFATRPEGDANAHPKGLRIRGATIDGRLDFEDRTLPRPLFLNKCNITDGIRP